jgi:hypothetical protein
LHESGGLTHEGLASNLRDTVWSTAGIEGICPIACGERSLTKPQSEIDESWNRSLKPSWNSLCAEFITAVDFWFVRLKFS